MTLLRPTGRSPKALIATAILLLLLGLAMAIGGVRLVTLGGSWYYVLAGVSLVVSGTWLFQARRAGVLVYAAFLLATVMWAVVEVGLDWWQLVPRVSLWFVMGLWLVTPWVQRSWRAVDRPGVDRQGRGLGGNAPLWSALGLALVVGVASGLIQRQDVSASTTGEAAGAPLAANDPAAGQNGDWPAWGGTGFGNRYSALGQITPENVSKLQVAWSYRTGDMPGADDPTEITDENTPLKIGDLLYVCTPHSIAIALDASTGAERWRYDPKISSPEGFKHFEHMTCRGVAYHDDATARAAVALPASAAASASPAPGASAAAPVSATNCSRRLFLPTADARLIALDAITGQPCKGFGDGGTVTLRTNIGPFKPGGYYATSPPAVTHDLVIVGGHVSDNVSNNEPSGVIRAYDVHDGHLVWNWDAGNPEQTTPLASGQTYTRNSPNMWSVASVDEALGLIYLPMGNQTPDQWGGQRTPSSERFSAGVVALDIVTGKVRWNYQFTHHDLWDMDVGGQPTLVDLQTADGVKPAVVASTKQGSIYVLDRRTGVPIVPVTETPVPQGAVAGDFTAPSQPMSALNFMPQPLKEADMWGGTPLDQLWCRINFRSLRYEGIYTPPTDQGSLVYPGNFGVFDWGGVSVDPVRQLLFATPAYMAFQSRLIPKAKAGEGGKASGAEATSENNGIKRVEGIPFDIELKPMLSPLGIPCQAPPWGYVAGVDLKTGKTVWQHKNGTIRDSSPIPIPVPLGVPSLGGTVLTASGLGFLTGTLDAYVRAYDTRSGKELWKGRLPAGAQSNPMSYADSHGKQYIVVSAGGHGSLGTKAGDHVIAYALP